MSKRGRMVYTPPFILEDLDEIMKEENIQKRKDGFLKMTEYAKIGREVSKLISFKNAGRINSNYKRLK